MDWMPFAAEDIRFNLMCGIQDDGHWHGYYSLDVRADALRHYGLHPDQPWSGVAEPTPPGWWRAEALRRMIGAERHRRRR